MIGPWKTPRRRRRSTTEKVIEATVQRAAHAHGLTARRISCSAAVVLDRMRAHAARAADGRCAQSARALGLPLEREDGPVYAPDTVQNALRELRALGVIRAVGTARDRATVYEVAPLAERAADAAKARP